MLAATIDKPQYVRRLHGCARPERHRRDERHEDNEAATSAAIQ
ncbi:MAG TPA: hypothetical protein VFU99_03265 [Gaiellaceae bacterium]|nr:hypothetical protein [Gaiellaceae bacterium]